MSTKLATILADFTTSLATALIVGATTCTLQSATDDDSVALPTGVYFFTLDGANSSKEHIVCALTGTAVTAISTVSRQGVQASGVVRAHRIGCTVTITDFGHILYMNDLLKGTTTFNSAVPLGYDGAPTLTPGSNQFATILYADNLAIAGSPKATSATYGLAKLSTAAVDVNIPIVVGDNDGRVPTQAENDSLVGNNTDIAVGSGNKMVTQTGLQHNAEKYVADSSASSTAYAAVLSPVPTSYTAGMIFYVKIINANTTTTPTLNVNGLGAKTIVKDVNTALVAGDITANKFCMFQYDGTNMVLQNVGKSADVQIFTGNGTWTKPSGAKAVTVICIGGGAGGGSGCKATTAQSNSGGGGGGGAVTITNFNASELDATETVTVSAGSAGGVAQSTADTAGNNGIIGGNSSFGTRVKAGGGGLGAGGTLNTATLALGGGGGGSFDAGSGKTGGIPTATTDGQAWQGATAHATGSSGYCSEWGGAAGGGSNNTGGSSIYGGAGGGGGGAWNGSGTAAGAAGGTVGSYTAAGGGAGGSNANNSPGTAGSANSVLKKGYGGAGGGGGSYSGGAGTGGTGGAGGIPGGGGGGGGATQTGTSGAGGAGARGQVTVITYF